MFGRGANQAYGLSELPMLEVNWNTEQHPPRGGGGGGGGGGLFVLIMGRGERDGGDFGDREKGVEKGGEKGRGNNVKKKGEKNKKGTRKPKCKHGFSPAPPPPPPQGHICFVYVCQRREEIIYK